jgi:glycine cleavage system regulatory protein
MKIRVDDPQLVDELVQHLRRSGCQAAPSEVEAHGGGVTVDVQLPAALDEEQARMEIELYLRVFEATHPGRTALLLT